MRFFLCIIITSLQVLQGCAVRPFKRKPWICWENGVLLSHTAVAQQTDSSRYFWKTSILQNQLPLLCRRKHTWKHNHWNKVFIEINHCGLDNDIICSITVLFSLKHHWFIFHEDTVAKQRKCPEVLQCNKWPPMTMLLLWSPDGWTSPCLHSTESHSITFIPDCIPFLPHPFDRRLLFCVLHVVHEKLKVGFTVDPNNKHLTHERGCAACCAHPLSDHMCTVEEHRLTSFLDDKHNKYWQKK